MQSFPACSVFQSNSEKKLSSNILSLCSSLHLHFYFSPQIKYFGLHSEISGSSSTNTIWAASPSLQSIPGGIFRKNKVFILKSSGVLVHLVVTTFQSSFSCWNYILILKLVNKPKKKKIAYQQINFLKNPLNTKTLLF